MEKLQQLTAYDKLADDAGIIDKYVFLDNIKALAKYDESYKSLLDKLIDLSEKYIEIEPNLSYDDFYSILGNIYSVTGGLCFIPLYSIVCNYTNTKVQEYIDYNEMKQVVYKLYIENYSKFIELIKQVITPSGRRKWTIQIPNKPVHIEPIFKPGEIPKVPEVPELREDD